MWSQSVELLGGGRGTVDVGCCDDVGGRFSSADHTDGMDCGGKWNLNLQRALLRTNLFLQRSPSEFMTATHSGGELELSLQSCAAESLRNGRRREDAVAGEEQ